MDRRKSFQESGLAQVKGQQTKSVTIADVINEPVCSINSWADACGSER
jgi:hypothetical protein